MHSSDWEEAQPSGTDRVSHPAQERTRLCLMPRRIARSFCERQRGREEFLKKVVCYQRLVATYHGTRTSPGQRPRPRVASRFIRRLLPFLCGRVAIKRGNKAQRGCQKRKLSGEMPRWPWSALALTAPPDKPPALYLPGRSKRGWGSPLPGRALRLLPPRRGARGSPS